MARCACLGTVWGINGGASVGGPPIDRYGTDAQKQKYLAPLLRGLQRHCLCVTEPAGKLHHPTLEIRSKDRLQCTDDSFSGL